MLNNPVKYRWLLFGTAGAIYFLVCLHRISSTVIARDLVLEFGADATALGLMASAYFYPYAAVQSPVGVLSDTLGPRRIITLFTLIAFLGAILFGSATNMTMATLARGLIGIGVGGVFVPSLKGFSRWFREKEFASVMGVFLALGNAGNLSASLPLTYLVLFLGWRMSFVAIGMTSLLLALLCWSVFRDRPEDKGWTPLESQPPQPSTLADAHPEEMTTRRRLGIVLKTPRFWMVTGSIFFMGGPGLTFQGLWAVPYLMDVHGFSRVQAGGLLMLFPLGFIFGAPVFGFFSDRLFSNRFAVLLISLSFGLAGWTVFMATGGKPPASFLAPLFVVMGVCGGGSLSLYMTIMKELFPPHLTGTAVGLMNTAPFICTALFQPFSGVLMDAVGRTGLVYPLEAYHHVFISFCAAMALGILCIAPLSFFWLLRRAPAV